MLKSIIRMTAVVTVIITAMLSYTQLSFLEKDYPLGTQYSGTILFSDSSLSRAEILDGMRHISREQGIEIYEAYSWGVGEYDSEDGVDGGSEGCVGAAVVRCEGCARFSIARYFVL